LLQSAGAAIAALTNSPHNAELLPDGQATSMDKRKIAFRSHVEQYYTKLNELDETLKRQTTALENAGILAKQETRAEEGVTNMGMGDLDIAWLNSRGRDIGLTKEQELLAQAKTFIEDADPDAMKE